MERKITNKSQYWQMVRGICILAVIMIHCPSGQNYTNLDYTVWIVLRQFINFPVAMFIFLAGYFMTLEKMQGDFKTFLFKRGGEDYFFHTWSGVVFICLKQLYLMGSFLDILYMR